MAAQSRLTRARRLLHTQEQLRTIAEIERAASRDRAAGIEADRAALLAALSACAGGLPLLDATAGRLRGLAVEASALEETAARQDAALRERGLGAKRAEILAERLAAVDRREREGKENRERLDGIAASGSAGQPGDASLP